MHKLKWVSFKICILYFVLCSACTHIGKIDISRRTIKYHVFSLAVLENESKHKVHPNIKTGKVDKSPRTIYRSTRTALKLEVNSDSLEGYAAPAPIMAPVVLLLLQVNLHAYWKD
jgi:hypothetical protein